MTTRNERAPIMVEIEAVVEFFRDSLHREKTIGKNTLGVEKGTGWIYYPGEKVPWNAEVTLIEKGVPCEIVVIDGQICPDPCDNHRIYYQLSRTYCLAEFLFREIPKTGRRYLDYDEPERRFLDLCVIRDHARRDLSMFFQEMRPNESLSFLYKSKKSPSLYEWVGPPVVKTRQGSVLTRYIKNNSQ